MTMFRLCASLFLVFWPLPLSAQQGDFLRAEETFRLAVERGQREEIVLCWEIADGYYLYRDHIEVKDAVTGDKAALVTGPGRYGKRRPEFRAFGGLLRAGCRAPWGRCSRDMRDLAVMGPPTMIFFDSKAAEASGTRIVGEVTADILQASIERMGRR